MKINKLTNLALVAVMPFIFTACAEKGPSYRLGQFTIASSQNIRNLNYSYEDKTKIETYGEDCYKVGDLPNDMRLQRAMDNAISNGHKKGIDGDILVNVRIDQAIIERKTGFMGMGEMYNCMSVKGDLVKLNNSNTK